MKIESTEDTPEVVMDAKNGFILLAGKSYPEDVEKFFKPISNWVDEYLQSPKELTEIVFKLEYFNTSTSKKILEMLLNLETIVNDGKQLNVKWLYSDDDEDMKNAGKKFLSLTNCSFELEKY